MVLDQARSAGVGDGQIEILEAAAEAGDLSLAQLRDAVHNTFSCFDASGLTYEETPDTRPNAPPGILYNYNVGPGMSEEEAYPLGQACIKEESYFVEMLFAASPASIESKEVMFAEIRDELIECLESKGVEADEEASDNELIAAAMAGSPSSDGFEGDPALMELLEPCMNLVREALLIRR